MGSGKPKRTMNLWVVVVMVVAAGVWESESASSRPTVFEILPKYGLPIGLLPDCVKDYTLSESDGEFSVELEHSCYIKFDYLVYYDTRITGTLKIGSISNLKGIQVKSLFLWFDLDEIKVDLPPSDSIYFQVGLINKKLSVHQFDTVHSCRPAITYAHPLPLVFQFTSPVDQQVSMLLTE